MTFTFLDMKGKTLFTRDDAERAQWTTEELSLDLEFPFLSGKVISIGQRVLFTSPTGETEIYEIKQAKTSEPESFQQVVAEHICISELSDEHIDNKEITDKKVKKVIEDLLEGTQWEVGYVAVNPTSSADISRGSVWQAVLQVASNWNVYIEPSVSISSSGEITRKLVVRSTEGSFQGLRLSIDKNMLDPSVTYDDSDVYTALYGYGGTDSSKDDAKEVTFADVEWSETSSHPKKPKGKKYLEDKEATRLYGRDGRARFGFYQNTDILDPEKLLEKTWEVLKTKNSPDISIEGTVADLYRLGYADTPIKLHNIALVEVLPMGFQKQLQIIRYTADLIDPSASTLTIGSYIPNIIYINRETNKNATGSSGGGGNTSPVPTWQEFRTTIQAYQDGTGMRITAVQNDNKRQDQEIAIQEGHIEVLYNKIELEVTDRRNADGELAARITITASEIRSEVENEVSGLNSTISQTASQIRSEVKNTVSGVYSTITQTASQIRSEVHNISSGIYSAIDQTASQIRTEVNNAVSGLSSSITQTASQIRSEVNNSVSGLQSQITQNAGNIELKVSKDGVIGSINVSPENVVIKAAKVNLEGYVTASMLETAFSDVQQMTVGQLTVSQNGYFTCLGHNVTWKSLTFTRVTGTSSQLYFIYGSSTTSTTGSGAVHGRLITDTASSTIHWLGY